jgi:hypothetical protein
MSDRGLSACVETIVSIVTPSPAQPWCQARSCRRGRERRDKAEGRKEQLKQHTGYFREQRVRCALGEYQRFKYGTRGP